MAVFQIFGKNSGKDCSITITGTGGSNDFQINAAELGILTNVVIDSDYHFFGTRSVVNGKVYNKSIPAGLKVVLKFSRTNRALEDLDTAIREAAYNGNDITFTMQISVLNRDGTQVDTTLFIDGVAGNFKLGHYAPAADVEQSVEFLFAESRRTNGGTGLFNGTGGLFD